MDVHIILVPPAHIEKIWADAEPFLQRSYEKADQGVPEGLRAELAGGMRSLWLLLDSNSTVIGAGITALYQLKSGKMLRIEHLGGDHREHWTDKRSVIEAYAKDQGCDRVRCEGRPGWARILTDYEPIAVTLEKRL